MIKTLLAHLEDHELVQGQLSAEEQIQENLTLLL